MRQMEQVCKTIARAEQPPGYNTRAMRTTTYCVDLYLLCGVSRLQKLITFIRDYFYYF